jgi:hypothetical protein
VFDTTQPLSSDELEDQRVEFLPARTVMSTFPLSRSDFLHDADGGFQIGAGGQGGGNGGGPGGGNGGHGLSGGSGGDGGDGIGGNGNGGDGIGGPGVGDVWR